MFYVLCPFCHIGIEISANDDGPDCTESNNISHCSVCKEALYFDERDVHAEPLPEPTV